MLGKCDKFQVQINTSKSFFSSLHGCQFQAVPATRYIQCCWRLQLFFHSFIRRWWKSFFPKENQKKYEIDFLGARCDALLCHMCLQHTLMECVVIFRNPPPPPPSSSVSYSELNEEKVFVDCEKLCRCTSMLCGKRNEIWVWLKLNKHGALHTHHNSRISPRIPLLFLFQLQCSILDAGISLQLSVNSLTSSQFFAVQNFDVIFFGALSNNMKSARKPAENIANIQVINSHSKRSCRDTLPWHIFLA